MGPRAGLDGRKISSPSDSIPNCPARNQSLYLLSYSTHHYLIAVNTSCVNRQTFQSNRGSKNARKVLLECACFYFFFRDATAASGSEPLQIRGLAITLTHISQSVDSSGLAISLTQIPAPDNTKQSQETTLHAPGGFELTIPTSERS